MKAIISGISITNFKSLKDTGILELKPITLLVGMNNSGKTTLLQSILMLKHAIKNLGQSIDFLNKIYYISPLREYPERYYIESHEHIDDVGIKGEYTTEFLYHKSKMDGDRGRYERVKEWIKRFGSEIEIREIEDGDYVMYSVFITDPNTKLSVNIADAGSGLLQVLPIIVQGIYAEKGSILLIEHPEIHLHPKMQAELMDLFIDIAKDDKQLIVETHSDHLIFRLQRRIAEGELSCDDVVIYSFETKDEDTKITKVKLNEDGTIEYWPKGFFEIEVEETKSFINALAKRRKNEGRRDEVPSG